MIGMLRIHIVVDSLINNFYFFYFIYIHVWNTRWGSMTCPAVILPSCDTPGLFDVLDWHDFYYSKGAHRSSFVVPGRFRLVSWWCARTRKGCAVSDGSHHSVFVWKFSLCWCNYYRWQFGRKIDKINKTFQLMNRPYRSRVLG